MPGDREVTLEGDEVYTRVGENRPPLARKDGQSALSNAVVATAELHLLSVALQSIGISSGFNLYSKI